MTSFDSSHTLSQSADLSNRSTLNNCFLSILHARIENIVCAPSGFNNFPLLIIRLPNAHQYIDYASGFYDTSSAYTLINHKWAFGEAENMFGMSYDHVFRV